MTDDIQFGGAGGLDNVVEDLTPQLGGDLDLNGNDITNMVIGTDIQAFDADTAKTDVAQEYTATQNFNATALTSTAASIAWAAPSNQVVTHTATEDTTLANPSGLVAGATYIFIWTQHASSPKTLAFGSAYKWPGGSAPTITATNAAVDVLTFVSDGTNMYGVAQLAFS